MTDLNSVMINGHVTADIIDGQNYAYTKSGSAKLTFSIACNRAVKDAGGNWKDEVSFFDIVAWGKAAENLRQKLYKGVEVVVVGTLQQNTWTDNNGNRKQKVVIASERVKVFNRNGNNGNNGRNGYNEPYDTYEFRNYQEQGNFPNF